MAMAPTHHYEINADLLSLFKSQPRLTLNLDP
jgi:hypothetical protein